MRRRVAWCSLVLLAFIGANGHAQQPTTVQLPTFSTFSGNTTVVVPDGGSVYMGGIRRAASGRSEAGVPMLPFRPFRNTAIGNERSVSSLHVTATIHDFEAMDQFLLGQPPSFVGQHAMQRPAIQQHAFPPWPAVPATVTHRQDPRVGSSWKLAIRQPEVSAASRIAQIQAQSHSRRAADAADASDFFQRGRKAEESGKLGVAKIYYRMAVPRADDPLRSQVVARLEAIARTETGSQVVRNGP